MKHSRITILAVTAAVFALASSASYAGANGNCEYYSKSNPDKRFTFDHPNVNADNCESSRARNHIAQNSGIKDVVTAWVFKS